MLVSYECMLYTCGYLVICVVKVIPCISLVLPSCGNSTSDSPSISVVTDLKAQARAECANGVFYFNNIDKAKLTLQVSFQGKNSGLCEFVVRASLEALWLANAIIVITAEI